MKGLKGVLTRSKSTGSSDASKKNKNSSPTPAPTVPTEGPKSTTPAATPHSNSSSGSSGSSSKVQVQPDDTLASAPLQNHVATINSTIQNDAPIQSNQQAPLNIIVNNEQTPQQQQQQQQQQPFPMKSVPPAITVMSIDPQLGLHSPPSPATPGRLSGDKEMPKSGPLNRMKNQPLDAIPISKTPRRQRSSRFHVTERVTLEPLQMLDGKSSPSSSGVVPPLPCPSAHSSAH
ncbi:hypothetical protein KVV02_000537 [Mortierella alpina]|uniref:Uncharacterized protein n=1 Tax=Mortierella alpina TaxID=64518 RepID=A0A9P8CWK9_MORAP|nr:hypothetical protein KVV02_000537 [Mortierella alpina]